MSGFGTHSKVGFFVAVVVGSLVGYYSMFEAGFSVDESIVTSFVGFLCTMIFSIIPDVDSQHSKPRRFLGSIVLLTSVGSAILISAMDIPVVTSAAYNNINFSTMLPHPVEVTLSLIVVFFVVSMITMKLFDKKTKHRGMFHNPVIYLGLGGVIILVGYSMGFNNITGFRVIIAGGGVIVGFLTHFTLDL